MRVFLCSRVGTSASFPRMALDSTLRRRRAGIVVLAAALLMLIAGETVLQGRLTGLLFLGYWLACLLFTTAAILVAVLDARALRRQTREEARALLQSTITEIETDARAKRRRTGRREPRAGPRG
jgi:hypothetical protein